MPTDPEVLHYHAEPLGVQKGSPGRGIKTGKGNRTNAEAAICIAGGMRLSCGVQWLPRPV